MDSLAQGMGTCIEAIRDWMSQNRLCLKCKKCKCNWHEAITIESCSWIDFISVAYAKTKVIWGRRSNWQSAPPLLSSFPEASSNLYRRYYYLRQIRGVRRSLMVDSCHALVRALILSRLDYCNSLLSGTTWLLISQLGRNDQICRSCRTSAASMEQHCICDPRSTALVGCLLANPVQTLCSDSTLPTWIGAALPPSFHHSDLRPSISCSSAVLCFWGHCCSPICLLDFWPPGIPRLRTQSLEHSAIFIEIWWLLSINFQEQIKNFPFHSNGQRCSLALH